jgi:hypothetical protein
MSDFTVISNEQAKRLERLERFYGVMKNLVRANEPYDSSLSLSLVKTAMDTVEEED